MGWIFSGLECSALTAWAGSSAALSACHTEEDMIGEPNWIVEGGFDRSLAFPRVSTGGASLHAQLSASELLKGKTSTTLSYENGLLGPSSGMMPNYQIA